MENERVKSLKLTDNDSGDTFELDFNRDAVKFAEDREFQLDDVWKFPQTKVRELFWYAFRWHHKNVSKQRSDALLDKMGGLTQKILERLILLYQQAQMSNAFQDDEDLEKNVAVTVELD